MRAISRFTDEELAEMGAHVAGDARRRPPSARAPGDAARSSPLSPSGGSGAHDDALHATLSQPAWSRIDLLVEAAFERVAAAAAAWRAPLARAGDTLPKEAARTAGPAAAPDEDDIEPAEAPDLAAAAAASGQPGRPSTPPVAWASGSLGAARPIDVPVGARTTAPMAPVTVAGATAPLEPPGARAAPPLPDGITRRTESITAPQRVITTQQDGQAMQPSGAAPSGVAPALSPSVARPVAATPPLPVSARNTEPMRPVSVVPDRAAPLPEDAIFSSAPRPDLSLLATPGLPVAGAVIVGSATPRLFSPNGPTDALRVVSPARAVPRAPDHEEGEELDSAEIEEVPAPTAAPPPPVDARAAASTGVAADRSRRTTMPLRPIVVGGLDPATAPAGASSSPATARPVAPPPPPAVGPGQAPAVASIEAADVSGARRKRRGKPWFEELFDETYMATLPSLTAEQTQREAAFIVDALKLEGSASLLDLGCGHGRHALSLAARGYAVTGVDLSRPMLARASDAAREAGLTVELVHGDMRELSFDGRFDAAYCFATSFGYFEDDANRQVATQVARALKPGGRFLLDVVNRDYVIGELPTRVWWQGEGCMVLEEVDFNYYGSRLQSRRSVVFEDGRQLEHDISIRAYSLHELGKLLHHAGFRVTEVSGGLFQRGRFFGAESRQLLIVAEKRPT